MTLDILDRIEPAALAELLDLWVQAWAAAMPTIDFEARRSWFAERIAGSLAEGGRLIVMRGQPGQPPAGFALVDPSTHYLDQLAVHPTHQRRGLATTLVDAAKALCGETLHLHVNRDNAAALRFYRGLGFEVSGQDINPRSGLPVFAMAWRRRDGADETCIARR